MRRLTVLVGVFVAIVAQCCAASAGSWTLGIHTGGAAEAEATSSSVPSSVAASCNSTGGASITWGAVSHASSYSVYDATSSSGPYSLEAASVSGTSYTASGLATGNYWFEVVANVGSNWASANSSPTTSSTSFTTGYCGVNCSAATTSETQLNESGFTATAPVPSGATGPQVPITNAVAGNTNAGRFTSGADQASGDDYVVNMGANEVLNELEMTNPDYSTDYPRGFYVEVSANGTAWTTIANCTGTATPVIVSFPSQTKQYVEIVLNAASSTDWWSMEYFYAFSGGSSYNCSATTTGQTQAAESGFTATAPVPSGATGPQVPITNAVAGNTNAGRFTSGADQAVGDDYVVNMGSAQSIDELEMTNPDYAGDYARGFNIEVSSNGTSWSTVATCTGSATPEIVSFTAQTDQYIEVVLTTASATNWWSMEYFYVYGTGPQYNCSASTSGLTQLTESGFTATAPVPSGATGPQVPITNAVAGNTNAGRFTSGADQASGDDYIVNLGSAQTIDELEMTNPDYASDYPRGFNIEVSANDSTWSTVASCTGTGTPEIVSFPAQSDQYIEVVLTTSSATDWWSMEYFYLYN